MGRLIDADVLQAHFEKVKAESSRLIDVATIIGVQSVIDSQPTAYDVEKVMEQLKKEKCTRVTYKDKYGQGWNNGTQNAIFIVRKGGVVDE